MFASRGAAHSFSARFAASTREAVTSIERRCLSDARLPREAHRVMSRAASSFSFNRLVDPSLHVGRDLGRYGSKDYLTSAAVALDVLEQQLHHADFTHLR